MKFDEILQESAQLSLDMDMLRGGANPSGAKCVKFGIIACCEGETDPEDPNPTIPNTGSGNNMNIF